MVIGLALNKEGQSICLYSFRTKCDRGTMFTDAALARPLLLLNHVQTLQMPHIQWYSAGKCIFRKNNCERALDDSSDHSW